MDLMLLHLLNNLGMVKKFQRKQINFSFFSYSFNFFLNLTKKNETITIIRYIQKFTIVQNNE